ncbi:hypothetical protein Nmel_004606 [Mimus melanotis]
MKTNTEDSWVLTAPTNAFTLLVTQQMGGLSFQLAAYRGIALILGATSSTASEARSSVEKRSCEWCHRQSARGRGAQREPMPPTQSTTTEFICKITISLPFQKVPCLFSF